jgi:hypothetical protein
MAAGRSDPWAGDFPTLQDFFAAADKAEDREGFIAEVRENTHKRIAERVRAEIERDLQELAARYASS